MISIWLHEKRKAYNLKMSPWIFQTINCQTLFNVSIYAPHCLEMLSSITDIDRQWILPRFKLFAISRSKCICWKQFKYVYSQREREVSLQGGKWQCVQKKKRLKYLYSHICSNDFVLKLNKLVSCKIGQFN